MVQNIHIFPEKYAPQHGIEVVKERNIE